MSPKLRELLLKQREAFVQKFGREPGLTEPVFFDPALMILSHWMPMK